MPVLYQPDLLYQKGSFVSGAGILVGDDGKILSILPFDTSVSGEKIRLTGKAILLGSVNGHSHTFQRLIRGRSENHGIYGDDFWTWRNAMYRAALAVDPEDGELITLAGPTHPRIGKELQELSVMKDGAMLIDDGHISSVGTYSDISRC